MNPKNEVKLIKVMELSNLKMTKAEIVSRKGGLRKGVLGLVAAYVSALIAAISVGFLLKNQHNLLIVLGADVAGTVIIFLFSRLFNNSSFYDPYWSVAPLAISFYLLFITDKITIYQIAITALVCAWGIRLTWNFLRGWRGLEHEDWRYVDFREKHGARYWPVSFWGIHLTPTIIVYLGCLPLFPALLSPSCESGWLAFVSVIVTTLAIWIEGAADNQLRDFRRENHGSAKILKSGLWGRVRHPNYLGEILFWWGIFLFGLSADLGSWPMIVGPVVITALFVFISIPMIDKRMLRKRPEYAEHIANVPAIIPRFKKLNRSEAT